MTVLRTLRPSRQTLAPTQAQAVDYGAPLAEAMGNLSGAYETQSVVLGQLEDAGITLQKAREAHAEAEKSRQQKLARANHLVRFAQMRGQYQRDLMDLHREHPASGQGYYQASAKLLEQHVTDFTNGIEDDELRQEFANNTATFANQALTQNYGQELTLQSAFYIDGFQQLQQDALNQIQSGESSYEEWAPIFKNYLENSPLPQQETLKLIDAARESLQEADFARQSLEEATDFESIRGSHVPNDSRANGQVAAAGLPGHAVGLLSAIGAVESGGLQYDLMYGNRRFSDFSRHPGSPARITSGPHAGETSSAAGAFQFLESTWNEAAAALGLTDFSPESQTRAAWWLANRDYSAKTGRSLELDLASGDPVKIERVRLALAGRGRETTWEGLQNMSPTEFYARVTQGQSTPTGILEDELYDAVPFSRKIELVQLAEQQRQEQLSKSLEQQAAVTNAAIVEMQGKIKAGLATQAEIDRFSFQAALDANQEQSLNEFYQTEQADRYAAEQFAANFQDTDYVFGTADQDELDVAYERAYRPIVQEGDAEAFRQELLPVLQRTSMMPSTLRADLEQGRLSNDINRARFAMMALREIQNIESMPASAISEEARADAIYYNKTRDYYPEEAVLENIRMRNSQENRAAREMAEDLIQTAQKDHPEQFQASSIAARIDPRLTLGRPNVAGGQRMALEADFMRVYRTEFYRYGDHGQAMDAATEIMRAEWGMSELGGEERFMRLPPQKAGYPAHLGSMEYIEEQIREEPLVGDAPYELLPDSQTRFEMQAGGAKNEAGNVVSGPTYMVKVEKDGYPQLVHDESGKPLRLGFLSPTQRLREEDGAVQIDALSAQVEAGSWVREFREFRSAIGESDLIAEYQAVPLDQRYNFLQKNPEVRAALEEMNAEFNSILSRSPEGYEEYTGSMRTVIDSINHKLLTPTAPWEGLQ